MLAVVQWVMGMSDSSNLAFSKPVILFLSQLVVPAQEEVNVGYNLAELDLSYHHPA